MWLCLLCIILVSWLLVAWVNWRRQKGEGRALVLVLGDVGRSPRMQYHCLSLLRVGYAVDLVGYSGSSLIRELCENENLKHHSLTECSTLAGLPSMIRYFLKVIFLTFNLLWVILIRTPKPAVLLVQTPPSIPTLFVSVLVCYLRNSTLLVDYHNYGHTILALTLGNKNPLVKFSKIYERELSRFAHFNLCVSKAMQTDLQSTLGIRATVFYDRPPERFQPANLCQKHKLFMKLALESDVFKGDSNTEESVTQFTEVRADKVVMKKDRPFLLVSSTSWTEDEDFSVLLRALEDYNTVAVNTRETLPKILCIITGKGPLKEYYMKLMQTKNLSHVKIHTLWLSAEDYPVLLGSADLGVCLHKSSSGLDLPMKVVDMFGCGLPVCAIKFECLHELVIHGQNGMVFSDSSELSVQIQELCKGFPDNNSQLAYFQQNLCSFRNLRWDHYWRLHVFPLVRNL